MAFGPKTSCFSVEWDFKMFYFQISNTKRKTRPQQGRHRSVSVSSGDSDDEEVDGSASAKIRQRSASTAPKDHHQSATPPTFKESRFFHGNRHKNSSHLSTAFPSLHKSVSTPSIVVDQNLGHSRKKYAFFAF